MKKIFRYDNKIVELNTSHPNVSDEDLKNLYAAGYAADVENFLISIRPKLQHTDFDTYFYSITGKNVYFPSKTGSRKTTVALSVTAAVLAAAVIALSVVCYFLNKKVENLDISLKDTQMKVSEVDCEWLASNAYLFGQYDVDLTKCEVEISLEEGASHYHLSGCLVGNSEYVTLEYALDHGYTACSLCKPQRQIIKYAATNSLY